MIGVEADIQYAGFGRGNDNNGLYNPFFYGYGYGHNGGNDDGYFAPGLEALAKAVAQQKNKTNRVTPRAVTLAVRHDDDLGTLLKDVTIARGGVIPNVHKALEKKKKGAKKAVASK